MPKKCKNIANLLKPQNMKKYLIFILLSISSFVYSQSEVYNSSDILKMQENYIASIDRIEIKYNEKFVTLRNDVIHKGYIPKTEQAIDFGEYVLDLIYKIIKNLHSTMPNFFEECTFAVYDINASKIPKKVKLVYSGGPTLIGLNKIETGEFGNSTLREILSDKSKHSFLRNIYYNGI